MQAQQIKDLVSHAELDANKKKDKKSGLSIYLEDVCAGFNDGKILESKIVKEENQGIDK